MSTWLVWQIVDSAFPTGGFAHSWGLESAWQHGEVTGGDAVREFVRASLLQAGRGLLPLVNAAYRDPGRLADLDDLCDAFLTNTVANRASRVQGRTLVSTCARVWPSARLGALEVTARGGYGHAGPVAGATFEVLGVPLETTQRIALYLVARGVLSAAVRLGIIGAYEAQRVQSDCAADLDEVLERCGQLDERDLAQTAPVIDLLQSAHGRLYSRLFQS